MKKFIALIVTALFLLTLCACNGGDVIDTVPTSVTPSDTAKADVPKTQAPETNAHFDNVSDGKNIIPTVNADTLGGRIWKAFYNGITANPNASAEELAADIAGAGIAPYLLGAGTLNSYVSPDNEGRLYLQGFDNYDFAGLDIEKSALFQPMIGSTPFLGYIFELSDGSDAAGFIRILEENANLRWQVCVSANQMVAGSIGNKVFFLMCNN